MPEPGHGAGGPPVHAEPASTFFYSQRLRLHCVEWGNAAAPPLVLLHGGRDHCRNWDGLAAQLCGAWHVIAPDLRGHGDSDWCADGQYRMDAFVCDLSQLIAQRDLAPVTLVGHSLGGNVCVRYAALYPERVRRLVSIEGLGPSPKVSAAEAAVPIAERLRTWIGQQHELARRIPRSYATIALAGARMREQNPRLTEAQVTHLTWHGLKRNEDGTYSWKFDNYLRSSSPVDLSRAQLAELWGAITCPTLLVYGAESWASNPREDGRAQHFRNAQVSVVERAGHWLHHERPAEFVSLLRNFLEGASDSSSPGSPPA